MERNKGRTFEPPDGRYGWVILLSSIVINISALPISQCFGIVFQHQFAAMEINATRISFLLHLNNSVTCILGLFSGALLSKFTYRELCVFGSLLISFGTCLTSFANSYAHFIITFCILIGCGLGIILPALSLAVNTYFKKRLTLAMTIQVAGTSLSPIFMPQLCTYLLKEYGTSGTVLILGGISLHAIIASLLLRPLRPTRNTDSKDKTIDKEEMSQLRAANSNEDDNDGGNGHRDEIRENNFKSPSSNNISEKLPIFVPLTSCNEVYKETTVPNPERDTVWKKLMKFFSFDLLADRTYLMLLIGMSFSFASELNVALLMPFILSELVSFDLANVASAMSIHATADIIGRLSVPFLAFGLIGFTPKMMYCFSLILTCIGRTVLSASDNKIVVLSSTVIIGYGKGTKAVIQSLILPHYMPFDKLAACLGLLMTTNGLVSLIIGPIIGFVHDVSNSYVPSLHTASAISMLCIILWMVDKRLLRNKSQRNDNDDADEQV